MSEGIAIAMGTLTKYTQGARFLCSEETCPFSEGNKKNPKPQTKNPKQKALCTIS